MEGLDGAVVVVGDVHNDGALAHQLEHGPVNEPVVAALGPLHAVEHHVGLGQQGGNVLLGTHHGVDVLIVLPLQGAQDADVDVHNGDPGAQGVEHRQGGLSHGAAAQDEHLHGGGAAQAADEHTLAAVDGEHGLQTHQSALLAGGLAVGGAVAVAVLGGEGDTAAVQNGLNLLGMGGGVDAGKDDLPLPQQRELAGLQLLHLGDEVGLGVDLLHGVHQLGSGGLVGAVSEAGLLAGPALDQGGVAVIDDGGDLHRGGDGTVLAVLDVFQQTENHMDSSFNLRLMAAADLRSPQGPALTVFYWSIYTSWVPLSME